ncbi:MAG: hypothetical protein ACRDL4_13285 [Thermoleophilaceae bacterium]
MKVELSDPSLADDLASFLRRARCRAEQAEGGTLAVEVPDALPEETARLELEAYLTAWQSLHPGVRARRRPAYDL